jgi:hypothetical protein
VPSELGEAVESNDPSDTLPSNDEGGASADFTTRASVQRGYLIREEE